MLSKNVKLIASIALASSAFMLSNAKATVHADTISDSTPTSSIIKTSSEIQGDIHITKAYGVSNYEALRLAEESGINVKQVLGNSGYQVALRQDMFRRGSSWVKFYTYHGRKRVSIGVNSAIVKTWKYGGHGALYAIQAFAASRGVQLNPALTAAMHYELSRINDGYGYWWHIDLQGKGIVDSGRQK